MTDLECLVSPAKERFQVWFYLLTELGVGYRITSTCRTREEQAILYATYKAGKSKYPALAPGHSKHEKGLAVDVVFDGDVELVIGVILARLLGLRWAGPRDEVHFEL